VPKKIEAHPNKWSVVVGDPDRQTVRLFANQAAAEAEREHQVQSGRQVYVLPPVQAWGGKDNTLAHVRDQLQALATCAGLAAVEQNTQEVYQSMVDMAGILEDLAKSMLVAGLAKDPGDT